MRDCLARPRVAGAALPAGIPGAAALLALALCGTACAPAPAPPGREAGLEAAFSSLDKFVARTMRDQGTPGLALAVTDRDRLLRVATYGFADIGARVALRPEHLFQIGSISKSFTALCLLQEREAGRFDPRQPIAAYLPWFRVQTKYAPITGHHLLSHTAGIPGDRDDIPPSTLSYETWALRERRTGYSPGLHYAYSNIGFQILGCALSEIAGEPYADIVRKRIFEPLGMSASVASMTHDLYPRLAMGYRTLYDDRPSRPSHPLLPAPWEEYNWGDGGVASTPADLAAYLRMLLNRGAGPQGRLVSEESFKLLIQRAIPTGGGWFYGYGMGVHEEQGRTLIGHSGGMLGFSSMLLGDLDEGVGAVVFVNGPGEPSTVAEYALSAVSAARRGQEIPPLPPEVAPARVPKAAEYAGEFVSPDGGKLLLEAQGDQLLLVHGGRRICGGGVPRVAVVPERSIRRPAALPGPRRLGRLPRPLPVHEPLGVEHPGDPAQGGPVAGEPGGGGARHDPGAGRHFPGRERQVHGGRAALRLHPARAGAARQPVRRRLLPRLHTLIPRLAGIVEGTGILAVLRALRELETLVLEGTKPV